MKMFEKSLVCSLYFHSDLSAKPAGTHASRRPLVKAESVVFPMCTYKIRRKAGWWLMFNLLEEIFAFHRPEGRQKMDNVLEVTMCGVGEVNK